MASPTPSPEPPGAERAIAVAEVPASRGARWLVEGFGLFRRQPMVWIGLAAGWMVITFGLIMVPLVGGVVANFLQPVFFASFAIAARNAEAGQAVEMGDLFAGFRANVRALVNIGALLLVAEIAIFALMAALGLPVEIAAPEGSEAAPSLADYVRSLQGKEWIILVGLVLTAIVKGALWFAPPLIAFHALGAGHAIRWSVYAALSNLGAMLAYGVALFVVFFAAIIPWGLGLFIAIPVMLTSTWVGYREVFEPAARAP